MAHTTQADPTCRVLLWVDVASVLMPNTGANLIWLHFTMVWDLRTFYRHRSYQVSLIEQNLHRYVESRILLQAYVYENIR